MPQAYWIKFMCGCEGPFEPKATSTKKLIQKLKQAQDSVCPKCFLKLLEEDDHEKSTG